MNNGKKNTAQSFFVDAPAEEKLAKSKQERANDPESANFDFENQKESKVVPSLIIDKNSKLGPKEKVRVKAINDPDLANILWQLSLLSSVKTITEPLSE